MTLLRLRSYGDAPWLDWPQVFDATSVGCDSARVQEQPPHHGRRRIVRLVAAHPSEIGCERAIATTAGRPSFIARHQPKPFSSRDCNGQRLGQGRFNFGQSAACGDCPARRGENLVIPLSRRQSPIKTRRLFEVGSLATGVWPASGQDAACRLTRQLCVT